MKILRGIVLLVILVIVAGGIVVACLLAGDSDTSEPTISSATTQRVVVTSGASRAEPAPAALLETLCSGAEEGFEMTPIRGMAVRSNDYVKVYFVAMEFSVEGDEDQVGVWAVGDLYQHEGYMAVDDIAQAFTVWPDGDSTDAEVTMLKDGAQEAKTALRQ